MSGATGQPLGTFPFGRPLLPRVPSDGPKRCFLLGAYPSALHIRWTPPLGGGRRVQALAVDNEPEPFWNGSNESERVDAWRKGVGWNESFGDAAPAAELNGSSGRAVEEGWLTPLGLDRSEVWLTDCLDTYHLSEPMAKAIDSVYTPFAQAHDLPAAELPRHPDEEVIVRGAQNERLRAELAAAQPEILITLGNAALRVMRSLTGTAGPTSLVRDANYGSRLSTKLDGRSVTWYALVHPGQPREDWKSAHAVWAASVRR